MKIVMKVETKTVAVIELLLKRWTIEWKMLEELV